MPIRLALLLFLIWTVPLNAAQHALVIGIDRYQHIPMLQGAVNDAEAVRDALRATHNIRLSDERVLLNAQATRKGFIRAWEAMLKQASPGDTLIFTYAGHGGQEAEHGAPIDERDRLDETLMFYDFDPKKPALGRITDDELYGLFKKADAYRILFVADSCHSGGMARSTERPSGRSRAGGRWDIAADSPPPPIILPVKGDEGRLLEHVTVISAVDSDNLVVHEASFNGKQHGALSWFFAQAMRGKADGNENGRLERDELEQFLQEKVSTYMHRRQRPKLLPRGDTQAVLSFSGAIAAPPIPAATVAKKPDVSILVQNGSAPQGLQHTISASAPQAFDLRFLISGAKAEVFNKTGDKLAVIPGSALDRWQRIIDKNRLLQSLAARFDMRLKPIRIALREGNSLHRQGEIMRFSVAPGDIKENLNALTLFNLGGDGELQLLYPLPAYRDPLLVSKFPYKLPPMKIAPPFGGDDLVAVLCTTPAIGLHNLLAGSQPAIPKPEQIIAHLRNNRCQVGQYAFFSAK
ncbi:MAG: hypothetical protein GY862_07525 [Gammaproteobacteria bacterium]|nr:hypothetical protein [Gammaproteobacteria bacterium]